MNTQDKWVELLKFCGYVYSPIEANNPFKPGEKIIFEGWVCPNGLKCTELPPVTLVNIFSIVIPEAHKLGGSGYRLWTLLQQWSWELCRDMGKDTFNATKALVDTLYEVLIGESND